MSVIVKGGTKFFEKSFKSGGYNAETMCYVCSQKWLSSISVRTPGTVRSYFSISPQKPGGEKASILTARGRGLACRLERRRWLRLCMEVKNMAAKLTPKQERFVTEYLVDLNATQAAIRAGYKEKTAYSSGQRLLKNVEIQRAMTAAMKRREQRTEITADRVLKELARIALFDPRGLFNDDGDPIDISKLSDDTAAALAGLDVESKDWGDEVVTYTKKYKIADKLRALELLGKHLGMFEPKRNDGGEACGGGIIILPEATDIDDYE